MSRGHNIWKRNWKCSVAAPGITGMKAIIAGVIARMPQTKRSRGRPPLAGEAGRRYQVHLPPSVAEKLRAYGAGSISQGIVCAAKRIKEL